MRRPTPWRTGSLWFLRLSRSRSIISSCEVAHPRTRVRLLSTSLRLSKGSSSYLSVCCASKLAWQLYQQPCRKILAWISPLRMLTSCTVTSSVYLSVAWSTYASSSSSTWILRVRRDSNLRRDSNYISSSRMMQLRMLIRSLNFSMLLPAPVRKQMLSF